QGVHILAEDEALLLRSKEAFVDLDEKKRSPGDIWMVYGPRDYIPPVEVEIVEKRMSIPLDENEGIYVRDMRTGKVRAVTGRSYMLQPTEELWQKDLPSIVEQIFTKERASDESTKERDKTKVVSYRVPHNAAVQIYDYKEKKS